MTFLQSILLAIIEGVTEFLPISSTGHLTLVSYFFGIDQNTKFIFFEIAIQLGAILSVVIFYFKKFLNIRLLLKLFVGFLPTAIIGFLFYSKIKEIITMENLVAISLIVGGAIILITEKKYGKRIADEIKKELSLKDVFLLGLSQSLAMIPGVSRSGSMIVTGLWLKLTREKLVEYTFLLAVPTMTAATLYLAYKEKETVLNMSNEEMKIFLYGFLVSFITASLVIRLLLKFIKKYDFKFFGIYRIVLGTLLLIILNF